MFELLCMTTIALLFGLAMVFGGYRLFLFLLPLWGFFFGFGLGAQALQAFFGVGLLASVSSWVVGFLVGTLFAILSYLFYAIGIAILSASFGYGLGVAVMTGIGFGNGLITWLVAVAVGIIAMLVVFFFNIQKYAVIVITAFWGTGVIILTLLAAGRGLTIDQVASNPVVMVIQDSFWWFLFFVIVAGAGIVAQIRANRAYELEAYNRWAEM